MKIINKYNFFSTVCMVYTVISILKITIESLAYGTMDTNYVNFIWVLAISILGTFVISLHYYLQRFSLWLVVMGQYLVLLGLIDFCVWIEGHLVKLHPEAYRDIFWSFTIPYIIGAAFYYITFWYEVKKANAIIKDLKELKKMEDE
jgi:hypothetical protein